MIRSDYRNFYFDGVFLISPSILDLLRPYIYPEIAFIGLLLIVIIIYNSIVLRIVYGDDDKMAPKAQVDDWPGLLSSDYYSHLIGRR